MKKLLFLILFFSEFLNLKAQNPHFFNTSYSIHHASHPESNAIEIDSGFLVYSSFVYNNQRKINLTKLDADLKVVHTETHGLDGYRYNARGLSHFFPKVAGGFVGSGTRYVTDGDSISTVLMHYNNDGSLSHVNHYSHLFRNSCISITQSPNGDILSIGSTLPDTLQAVTAFLTRTDANGRLIWTKLLSDSGETYYFQQIRPALNPETYLISGAKTSKNYSSYEHVILIVDSLGNILSEKTYPTGTGGCRAEASVFDSTYVISGLKRIEDEDFARIPMIRKVRANGDLLWETVINTPFKYSDYRTNIIVEPNGRIVIGGNSIYTSSSGFGALTCYSFRGYQCWGNEYRFHPGVSSHQINNITKTSDGGYLLSGSTRTPHERIWLLKVDSMGCERAFCEPLALNDFEKNNAKNKTFIHIYPNPSNGLVNFTHEGSSGQIEFSVYNVQGKKILQKQETFEENMHVNLQFQFPRGVYFLRVFNGSDLVETKKFVIM